VNISQFVVEISWMRRFNLPSNIPVAFSDVFPNCLQNELTVSYCRILYCVRQKISIGGRDTIFAANNLPYLFQMRLLECLCAPGISGMSLSTKVR
jgi:hypothetical protein